jgi:hypothetical protein
MSRALRLLALALAAAAAPAAAWAQKPIPETVRMLEPHHLQIGDRVRAWTSAAARPAYEGTVVAVATSTVTITDREGAELLALPNLSRLEVRRTKSHVRRAAAIGAAVGAIAAALLVTEEIFNRPLDWEERAAWMGGITAGGAAAGAGIGYLTRSVTWQPVDLVTLKPQQAARAPAVRLAWTVRF